MRLSTVLGLVVAVTLLTAGGVYLFTRSHEAFPVGTQSLPYFFSVGADPGVDTQTDIFRLGQVTPGGSSWRSLAIDAGVSSATDEDQVRRRVVVLARGDGSAWVRIEPAVATLPADVNISLQVPSDAPFGEYRGTLYVVPYEQ